MKILICEPRAERKVVENFDQRQPDSFRWRLAVRNTSRDKRCTRIFFAVLWFCLLAAPVAADPPQHDLRFGRDVRPLLSKYCFECHGPDASSREAELRLDRKSGLFQKEGGVAILVPGDPQGSEIYRLISTDDQDLRMPPIDSGKSLTGEQIELIAAWIRQGADW